MSVRRLLDQGDKHLDDVVGASLSASRTGIQLSFIIICDCRGGLDTPLGLIKGTTTKEHVLELTIFLRKFRDSDSNPDAVIFYLNI